MPTVLLPFGRKNILLSTINNIIIITTYYTLISCIIIDSSNVLLDYGILYLESTCIEL